MFCIFQLPTNLNQQLDELDGRLNELQPTGEVATLITQLTTRITSLTTRVCYSYLLIYVLEQILIPMLKLLKYTKIIRQLLDMWNTVAICEIPLSDISSC